MQLALPERKRLEGVEPLYPHGLPALRRTLIIIDYDFGKVEHRIDLYRTPRIDCYYAVADGVEWKRRIGWSKVLGFSRQVSPRAGSLIFDVRVSRRRLRRGRANAVALVR